MAHFLQVVVQILISITSVAVQFVPEPEICHDAGFILWAGARIQVQEPLESCLERRSKCKKCDKQLTHIVRVMVWRFVKLWSERSD
jgi:hypothetical protein